MDAPLKELAKLEDLTSPNGKEHSIESTLDSLLKALQDVKQRVLSEEMDTPIFQGLVQTIESKKKEIEERQKEVYSSINRLGKVIDKVNIYTGVKQVLLT